MVGPGGDIGWTPIVVDDTTGWIDGFRGLWGLDTRDRFAGERAPAGPKYTRKATARQSWNDPLGFLGLDKLPPPGRVPAVLEKRIAAVDGGARGDPWRGRGQGRRGPPVRGVHPDPDRGDGPGARPDAGRARPGRPGGGACGLRARDAALDDDLEVTTNALGRAEAGDLGDPRAHLRQDHRPQPPESQRYGRVVEFWSAISAGLLVIVLAGTMLTGWVPIWAAVLIAVGGYVAIEAAFRRRLVQLALRVTLFLAVIGAIVLVLAFLPLIVVGGIAGVAIIAIVDNIRELRD